MRKFWIVFIIIAVVIGGGLGLLWKAASSLDGSGGSDAEGGLLHWRAGGALPEGRDDSFMGQLRSSGGPTFREVVFGLHRAARDPEVKAMVLELDGLAVSWAQLEELQDALQRFRDADKPVWSVVSFAGNADYALAAAAEHVVMVPEGNLMVLGVSAELAFLRDTMAKVGIEAEFLHVGEYKSAPEQLTRTEASEANREMTTSLVDQRYGLLVDLIAAGRGCTVDQVRGWIDVGMFDADLALAEGLVDTLLDVEDLLADLYPDENVADFDDYVLAGRGGRANHQVALVVAEGTIMSGESRQDPMQGTVLGSDTVVDQLARAREDEDIEAVILRVNSPGGSAMASDLMWREIERLRAVKPVVVSMGGYAASGGFYISCNGDSVFADRGTLTGSIGVFAGKMNWSGFYEKLDLHREFITRGENALFWHDSGGFSPNQRTLFQDQLDRFYSRFVDKVAEGRGMTPEAVDAVARGRVWTGEQALEVGLVDGIGGLSRAMDSARVLVGAEPDELLRVHTFGKELGWLERTMLDALRSSQLAAAMQPAPPFSAMPEPLAGMARALVHSGLADVAPLMDGRPVALMTWRPVAQPGGVTP